MLHVFFVTYRVCCYSLLYIECTVILCYRWSVVLFSVTDRMCCYSPFHKECALILCWIEHFISYHRENNYSLLRLFKTGCTCIWNCKLHARYMWSSSIKQIVKKVLPYKEFTLKCPLTSIICMNTDLFQH